MNKDKNNKVKNGDNVQKRLLDAAEKLFAEHGFDGVPVRDITSLANCNVAAINYHFGGKDKLYTEVFRRNLHVLRNVRVESINDVMSRDAAVTLEDLLSAFAQAFLEPLVQKSNGPQIMKLFVRERLDPHLPSGMFFEEMISPIMDTLLSALQKICPSLSHENAVCSIFSTVAQLLHTVYAQELFAHEGNDAVPDFDLSRAVDHIVTFSAAGIRAYVEQPQAEVQDA
jgi:AcrR family transcriptional regulator